MKGYILSVREVTKRYGSIHALDSFTLDIEKGWITGIVGPNGAGKTTLFKIVLNLLRPDHGSITVMGKGWGDRSFLSRVGYMPQVESIYEDLTIRENLSFFGKIYGLETRELKRNIEEVTGLVELKERAGEVARNLSGGMKRRLSFACALLHKPDLLILDEPTVGIDPELRVRFWDYFYSLQRGGKTILISTHHLEEAGKCQRIALMRRGRLVDFDTPGNIRERTGEEDLEKAFISMVKKGEAE